MSMVERVVRGWLDYTEQPPTRPKVQLGIRISADHADVLEAVAERLSTTKHGLAVELLEAAIEDAGDMVGVRIIQDFEGATEVALFENPMDKEEK